MKGVILLCFGLMFVCLVMSNKGCENESKWTCLSNVKGEAHTRFTPNECPIPDVSCADPDVEIMTDIKGINIKVKKQPLKRKITITIKYYNHNG